MPSSRTPGPCRRLLPIAACVAALVLAACHQAPPPPSNITPETAIATTLRLVATGDFDGLVKNRLPPDDYAVWRAEWQHQHDQPRPVSAVQREQFARIMQLLTGPDAEATLAKKLDALPTDKGHLPPVFSSIIKAAGHQLIEDAPQLGPAQKKMALQGLSAVMAWARTVDLGDRKKATRAIELLCSTARSLHVQTLEQWRSLDYEATMRDYGVIWNGMENLLAMYGMDLGQSLLDAQAKTLSRHGDEAEVRVDMQLAGKPLTGQWTMRRVAGHWYDAALLDAWRKAHPAASGSTGQPAGAASEAPAVGASAALPARHVPASMTAPSGGSTAARPASAQS